LPNELSQPWARHGRPLISVEEAWADIGSQVEPSPTRTKALRDCAGLILASPVSAQNDYPPFDKALMDGFAVRAGDCTSVGASLRIVGLTLAGAAPDQPLESGSGLRINTGAPLPPGADAVIPIEKCAVAANGETVTLNATIEPGKNVERRAAIRKSGDTIVDAGALLTPGRIAAIAAAGAGQIDVRHRPRVAVLLTGNEVVLAGSSLKAGQIHDSNGPMLAALLAQLGASSCRVLHSPDDPERLARQFKEALSEQVVIVVGGMSMGTHDLVPAAGESLGVTWRWHGVAMRPGRPVAYGRGKQGQHVFGLPGNPVSVFVCSWLFVKPVLDGLSGSMWHRFPTRPGESPVETGDLGNRFPTGRETGAPLRIQHAVLSIDLKPHSDPRPAYVPAITRSDPDGRVIIEPCKWQGSGDPFALAEANALLIRREPSTVRSAGSIVEYIVLY